MFKTALIANRGEIAVRLIRAFRELGIYTIAVYSQADQQALHVRLADQAMYIGEAPAVQSYLSQERILQAALESGAQAIHPGYGFLSENAAFAQVVQDAGLTFIGPSPSAIQAMGDKGAARARMIKAGVPVVPGYQGADDPQTLLRAAGEIGLPLLIKATAGGGGKGMRIAWQFADLPEALSAARNESLAAFGDGRLILERYIPRAHHIEIQILGDQHGNLLHLFERECSLQRRYQKIIEETPSPLLDDTNRQAMGAAAVAAARAVGYHNAGTVEFLFDPQNRQFYFLEMNTRLQVEHPITEMVAGLDLAQWQIRIAAGERLPFTQNELRQRGHAIECRLYAEDPANDFLPAAGRLLRWIEPKGPGVRVDSGFTSGDEISLHYDPLIAKIIVHAADRPSAIRKMQASLNETVALGLPTNWRFLQDVLAHPDFQEGLAHTAWVEECFDAWEAERCELPPEALIAAALTQFETLPASLGETPSVGSDPYSPWRSPKSFRLGRAGGG
jgi:acetyl-CoA carboxylase biotin carboxylase subunit